MSVIRINKTKNYTVMSNYHLQDKELSLKAKGVLSLMLSLPESWDYSIFGLTKLSRDGKDSVVTALQELEKNGYLIRTQKMNNKGQFDGYIYDIYETKQIVKENPFTENPNTEKHTQLNNNKININNKIIKNKYGEYKHVLLTKEQYDTLIKDYGESRTLKAIQKVDEYIETSGKSYKNHYLVLKKWGYDKNNPNDDFMHHNYTKQELDSLIDNLDDIEV